MRTSASTQTIRSYSLANDWPRIRHFCQVGERGERGPCGRLRRRRATPAGDPRDGDGAQRRVRDELARDVVGEHAEGLVGAGTIRVRDHGPEEREALEGLVVGLRGAVDRV